MKNFEEEGRRMAKVGRDGVGSGRLEGKVQAFQGHIESGHGLVSGSRFAALGCVFLAGLASSALGDAIDWRDARP